MATSTVCCNRLIQGSWFHQTNKTLQISSYKTHEVFNQISGNLRSTYEGESLSLRWSGGIPFKSRRDPYTGTSPETGYALQLCVCVCFCSALCSRTPFQPFEWAGLPQSHMGGSSLYRWSRLTDQSPSASLPRVSIK